MKIFRIKNLPTKIVDERKQYIRFCQVKRTSELPLFIKIRIEDLLPRWELPIHREFSKQEIIAGKLGLTIEELPGLGITDERIDLLGLHDRLRQSLPEIKLRAGEERTVDNVLRAIVGRLGVEEDVFVPVEERLNELSQDASFPAENLLPLVLAYAGQLSPKYLGRVSLKYCEDYLRGLLRGEAFPGYTFITDGEKFPRDQAVKKIAPRAVRNIRAFPDPSVKQAYLFMAADYFKEFSFDAVVEVVALGMMSIFKGDEDPRRRAIQALARRLYGDNFNGILLISQVADRVNELTSRQKIQ